MKPIVSFDVDMTLLDHKTWEIPVSAMEAIEKLRQRYTIVIATGRDLDSQFSRQLRDQLRPDAVIHLNGTKITVGSQVISSHTFDKDLLKRLLIYMNQLPYSLGATMDGVDYFVHPEVVTKHDMDIWGDTFRNFDDPWKLMDQNVRTLSYIGGEEGAKIIGADFPEISLHMFSEKRGADVVEKSASKAVGLQRLCDYYGLNISQTVAFGDSMNDYDMIKAAGLGIAMGNAMDELKAASDYVTDCVDQDGIWNACCHFHMI